MRPHIAESHRIDHENAEKGRRKTDRADNRKYPGFCFENGGSVPGERRIEKEKKRGKKGFDRFYPDDADIVLKNSIHF